ncbi:MAG: LacI family DNA-binding transcriptional regulator [Salinivirgaceae bacterium]
MKNNTDKRIGIKDIAARAGVSIGTVDRVLHNRGEVKEATRKKVLEIVQELDYTPNIFAKSLSSKRTTKLAIVIPDSSDNNPYWEKPVSGIKLAAEELTHYNTEILYEHFDASDEEAFKNVLRKVCDQNPDGIVLNPVFKDISLEFIQEFDKRAIPYVFIDINLKNVNNLAYYGQDAEQSGLVAARLMEASTPKVPNLLIVKQSKRKVFSSHIERRIEGFTRYYAERQKAINAQTIEIDLNAPNEPYQSLNKVFEMGNTYHGIFVPNSRGFKLAEYLKSRDLTNLVTIGYDLVDSNIDYMQQGYLTYLISQKPELQAYKAIWALFDHLVTKKPVRKTNYSAIDIIIKENIEYYLENK